MNIYLSYILLGFSLAAPVGPINAAQLNKGLRFGFWSAWMVGLGSMIAETTFMLLIYFGSAHFLTTPFMKTFLWLFGCFVLIYSGVESMVNAGKVQFSSRGEDVESGWKSFASGFVITLSNPLSILFWLGIYGSILAKTAEKYGAWDLLIYSSGIIIGLFLWDLAMATAAGVFQIIINERILVFISRLAGFSMLGFGIYFGYEAALLLFF